MKLLLIAFGGALGSVLRYLVAAVHPHAHRAVIVLEVAGGGECAEVDPLADHAVPDEAVVALLAVALRAGGSKRST